MIKSVSGKKFITLGEPMVMLVANEVGNLEDVETFQRHLAGAELNVAIGMARLGFQSIYVSKVGLDCWGNFIRASLLKEGVETKWISESQDHSTGMVFKSLQNDGRDPYVEYFRRNSAASTLSVKDFEPTLMNSGSHLHLTGVAAAVSPSLRSLSHLALEQAKAQGATTSFDTNLRPSLWPDLYTMRDSINALACQCDVVLPGIEEGRILTGNDQPELIADYYLNRGVKLVVVKLGSSGAYFKTAQGEWGRVEGVQVQHVVDTVGAGDSFAVGVISALLDGRTTKQAVWRGNWFGALAVQVRGDSEGLPTRMQFNQFEQENEI